MVLLQVMSHVKKIKKSKKNKEEMAKQRATFVEGAVKNGHAEEKAGTIFDLGGPLGQG